MTLDLKICAMTPPMGEKYTQFSQRSACENGCAYTYLSALNQFCKSECDTLTVHSAL